MMKKTVSWILTAALWCCVLSIGVGAESPPSITVLVTISDENGELPMVLERITVSDPDGNGVYTVDDALRAAHEAAYDGGAAAGYASYESEFGLSLGKLWGNESGAFGYRVNDSDVVGLQATVREGDHIKAYIYQDQSAWSDEYAWFDKNEVFFKDGETVTLTLQATGYDASWQPVTSAVADAVVTVNGEETTLRTDAEGKVTLALSGAADGEYFISAKLQDRVLVPPVCRVRREFWQASDAYVSIENSETKPAASELTDGCTSVVWGGGSVWLLLLGGLLCRKKED